MGDMFRGRALVPAGKTVYIEQGGVDLPKTGQYLPDGVDAVPVYHYTTTSRLLRAGALVIGRVAANVLTRDAPAQAAAARRLFLVAAQLGCGARAAGALLGAFRLGEGVDATAPVTISQVA